MFSVSSVPSFIYIATNDTHDYQSNQSPYSNLDIDVYAVLVCLQMQSWDAGPYPIIGERINAVLFYLQLPLHFRYTYKYPWSWLCVLDILRTIWFISIQSGNLLQLQTLILWGSKLWYCKLEENYKFSHSNWLTKYHIRREQEIM